MPHRSFPYKTPFAAALLALFTLLSGCVVAPAGYGLGEGEAQIRYGTVVQVDPVSLEGDHQLGVGSVIGSVAGGVLGHQFGGGNGRDVATILGALGGAVAGTNVQNTYVNRRPGEHVIVRLQNGVAVGITQPATGLRPGDPVVIAGAGMQARVERRQ